ncbi:MAG: quinone-dependent dihydroorotate dehydrogenase [Bdellovibrionales bacterium]
MNIFKKIDLWKRCDGFIDPYPLIRPFLFLLDPEFAHEMTMKTLKWGLGPHFHGPDDEILKTELWGLHFPNPIHLAAGLDKQATVIDECMGFGFGSIEIGGVTPEPQAGNPRPRMFRIKEAKALINRFGFNSVGLAVFAARMKAWRAKDGRTKNPVGVNMAKNKDTEVERDDYVRLLKGLAPYADYMTVNVSCPNSPGFCDMQEQGRMAALVKAVTDARDEVAPELPVLVKISPDITEDQQKEIAALMLSSKAQGLIVGNTTTTRPSSIPEDMAQEIGGLSGPVLFDSSTRLLAKMYKLTEGKVPLIGCGGVSSGKDAYAKIRAGASLVQVYTALIFEGPLVVQKMKRELADLLRRDGFKSVSEAVGVEHRAGSCIK